MRAGQRRVVGIFGILGFLLAWIVVIATLGSMMTAWPWWAQLAFYAAAGVAWVFPLRPLFAWMGRGT